MLIDSNTFQLLKKAIKKDGWMNLPAYGNSMFPLIRQGDICKFASCDPSLLKKGDVILFFSQSGQLIAHRYVRNETISNQKFFVFKGDSNIGFDPPISEEYLLGKLVTIQKHHIKISSEHFFAHLWGEMILTFPLLSSILRKHLNLKTKLQF